MTGTSVMAALYMRADYRLQMLLQEVVWRRKFIRLILKLLSLPLYRCIVKELFILYNIFLFYINNILIYDIKL